MPQKVKVYELAKSLGVTSVFLMDKIRRRWKLPVRSHMETLSVDMEEKIREMFQSSRSHVLEEKTPSKTRKRKAHEMEWTPLQDLKAFLLYKKVLAGSAEADLRQALKSQDKSFTCSNSAVKKRIQSFRHLDAGKGLSHAGKQSWRVFNEFKDRSIEEIEEVIERKEKTRPAPKHEKIIRRRRTESKKPQKQEEQKQTKKAVSDKEKSPPAAEEEKEELKEKSLPQAGAAGRGLFEAPSKKPPKKPAGEKSSFSSKFQAADFRKREVIFQPKKKRLVSSKAAKKTKITVPKSHKRVVKVHGEMRLKDLADAMGMKTRILSKKLKTEGVEAPNESHVLDFETIALALPSMGFEAKNTQTTETELLSQLSKASFHKAKEKPRPPVVTVMGHVDHGKTTLLDTIRSTEVAKKEAGGITQHIGAYSVSSKGKFITFIDTPGHAAFTAMRSRGAKATDIVVLVVSAADGVRPQTIEALSHAKAAKTPVIVAVNKMDLEGADIERVRKELSEHNLLSEEWGGDVAFVPISALKATGIPDLLERILLTAEMEELKSFPEKPAQGLVLEARREKGRGVIVTLLVLDGVLKRGESILAGEAAGRLRVLKNDKGETVPSVSAGFPVEAMGLSALPQAGDRFDVVENDSAAKRLIAMRKSRKAAEKKPLSPEELLLKAHAKESQAQELNLLLKADVSGGLEALKSSLEKLKGEKVKTRVIYSAVGAVTESDVLLAAASKAVVAAFNVRPDSKALRLAKEKSVSIKSGAVIYEIADQIKPMLLKMLRPEIVIEEKGRAEVREIFHISKAGAVAGCYVTEGQALRTGFVRLLRDGKVVHEGKPASIRRFKEDVQEVQAGFECGVSLESFNDLKPKDIIEFYIKKETPRTEL